MKLDKIIDIADKVYPDGMVGLYFQEEKDHGDTLAQFIAIELKETYDKNAKTEDQLTEAVRVMDTAIRELTSVRDALDDRLITEEQLLIRKGK